MGIWPVDHRIGLALVLLPAVCVAEPKKAGPIKPVRRLKAGSTDACEGPGVQVRQSLSATQSPKRSQGLRTEPSQIKAHPTTLAAALATSTSIETPGPIFMNEGLPRRMLD
jgi:hypothetical protein